MDYGTSLVTQRMAERYLCEGHWETGVLRIQEALTMRMGKLQMALRDVFGDTLTWQVPSGGGHLWINYQLPVTDSQLLQACIDEGILVTPGSIFGSATSHLRLTITYVHEQSIEDAVHRLHRAFEVCRKGMS